MLLQETGHALVLRADVGDQSGHCTVQVAQCTYGGALLKQLLGGEGQLPLVFVVEPFVAGVAGVAALSLQALLIPEVLDDIVA